MALTGTSPSMDGAANGEATVRQTTSKKALLKRHNALLKVQANGGNTSGGRAIKQPAMHLAYTASCTPLKELEQIPLSDLEGESHHRGKAVVARAIVPPYRGLGTLTIIEDEHGNVARLAIHNHSDVSILSNLPEGCIVAVKEPYFQADGENGHSICVDHPSDILLLRFSDPLIPGPLRTGKDGAMVQSAEEWKTTGDTAFIQHDFPTAVFCYTEGLDTVSASETALKSSMFAKRAGTNLMLGRYDAARSDALASRTGSPSDWRAYLTAAKASYGLCEYATSRTHFEAALEQCPPNAHTGTMRQDYDRCLDRLREEEKGDYDFEAMHAYLNPKRVHLDCASFTRNTTVKDSELHGRGLFAAKDFRAGDLVFAEKATFMPNQYDPEAASVALFAMAISQMYDNPTVAAAVAPLYAGDDFVRTGKEGAVVDGHPVVDVFLLESIRVKNCFGASMSSFESTRPSVELAKQQQQVASGASISNMTKGLWVHAAHMNHSCVPNTMRAFIGDVFISRATKDIKAGEELFQQYAPVKADPGLREKLYLENWGFECRCGLCVGERAADPSRAERRTAVLAQTEKLMMKRLPHKGPAPDSAIRAVDRLAKQLEELHGDGNDAEVYATLPRLMTVLPTMWLIHQHRRRKNNAKVVGYAMRLLRNFGFFLSSKPATNGTGNGGNGVEAGAAEGQVDLEVKTLFGREHENGLMTGHVVKALTFAADAYRALGKKKMAEECEEAAKLGYVMITGFENDPTVLAETI